MGDIKYSKKQLAEHWLTLHPAEEWGACIHCQSNLRYVDHYLVCEEGHQFDIAKQGYFFLSKHSLSATKYDKILFTARRHIIQETKLYHALHEELVKLAQEIEMPLIIDAGGGEGSHLLSLSKLLNQSSTLINIDLAKDGIQMATDYNEDSLAIVGDLALLPIQDGKADVILSILSPSNYVEFKRVLKVGGQLIKIVPNPQYLQEIRQGLAKLGVRDDEQYDNHQVIEVFQQHFSNYQQHTVIDQVAVNTEDKLALAQMTPLVWNLSEEQRAQLVDLLPGKVTLDVTILVGIKD